MTWWIALGATIAFSVVALAAALSGYLMPGWWFVVLAVAWLVTAVKWPEGR